MKGTPVSSSRGGTGDTPGSPTARRDPESLNPGDRVGEYVLEERIGQGGFGTVWRAHHAVLPGKVVAVKVPRDPELVELLRRESLLQHGLDHPGVLKVLGVNLEGDVPYLVEEYAEGGDLAALLRREGKLSFEKTLEVFEETVSILRHAHARGVVHRDLKPGNILLDGDGRVRIGDFGLGRGLEALTTSALRESIQSLGPFTDRRLLGGTWEYMAPEQKSAATAEGEQPPPDARADIYSLGVLLYEMLKGERPAGRVSLEDISPWLDGIFARCYTSIDRRYRDAAELLKALRRGRARAGRERRKSAAVQTASGTRDRESQRSVDSGAGKTHAWSLGSTILQRTFFFVPLVFVVGTLVFVALQEERASRQDTKAPVVAPEPEPAVLEEESDEAVRLGGIRRWIEGNPDNVAGGVSRLNGFLATADDGDLSQLALRWKRAIEASSSPATYEVCWRRYRIHKEAYEAAFNASMEPGQPDVYVRVYHTRDGKETNVYDSSSTPVEAWGHYWSRREEAPSFTLSWVRGDGLRLELRESDLFRDNTIARYEIADGLSILLLSSTRISPEGHVVELECDFDFGK